jgi:hypothetical protein
MEVFYHPDLGTFCSLKDDLSDLGGPYLEVAQMRRRDAAANDVLTPGERARARVMKIYAGRLKRLKRVERREMELLRRVELRMLMLLDSPAGRELCDLLLEQDRAES